MRRIHRAEYRTSENDGPFGHRLLPLLILAAGAAAYAGSLHGVFVFDDYIHIVHNERIRDLSHLPAVLAGQRPVVDLTLALNYASAGLERVANYHVVNVAVHLLAGLTLFGIVRRTLLSEPLRARFGRSAAPVALTAALIWTVHPLQTQSVTYVIQRAESMMGLFYLLTLYGVIRCGTGFQPVKDTGKLRGSHWFWGLAAVVACALGMGCKAVMISAPMVVLLYDRTFLAGSFRQALRCRYALYVGLAAGWGVLWWSGVAGGVLRTENAGAHVGFSYKGITPIEYALTQFGVLVDYLKLSLWPHPLCLDYSLPIARTLDEIAPPAVVILALVTLTILALVRRPAMGFLGATFFLILGPTSSFIPIKDVMFEHRMYLPLASLVVAFVVGGDRMMRRLAFAASIREGTQRRVSFAVVVAVVGALGVGTAFRNRTYAGAVGVWRDVIVKRPDNARAYEHLGTALINGGDKPAAAAAFEQAVRLNPDSTVARVDLANALLETGRAEEAIPQYQEALRRDPADIQAQINLGHAFDAVGRAFDAFQAFVHAGEMEGPRAPPQTRARAYFNVGSSVGRSGNIDGAINAYREAVLLWPEYEKAHFALGSALSMRSKYAEAIEHFDRVLALNPNDEAARRAREEALVRLGRP